MGIPWYLRSRNYSKKKLSKRMLIVRSLIHFSADSTDHKDCINSRAYTIDIYLHSTHTVSKFYSSRAQHFEIWIQKRHNISRNLITVQIRKTKCLSRYIYLGTCHVIFRVFFFIEAHTWKTTKVYVVNKMAAIRALRLRDLLF